MADEAKKPKRRRLKTMANLRAMVAQALRDLEAGAESCRIVASAQKSLAPYGHSRCGRPR